MRQLFNIVDKEQWLLLFIWLVTAPVVDMPRPCLIFHGQQGAGKSFAGKLIRNLIDPSRLDLAPTPTNQSEFLQQINNNHLIILDNLHELRSWMSDTLCRAITGAASSKRKLYSDSDDIIYQFKKLFILNGINNPATAADLLDRSIIIEFERISKENRKTEDEILNEFNEGSSHIFRYLLTVLAKALAIKDNLEIANLPRMADWARLGYAVAEVIGAGGERFLSAYNNNIQLQHQEVMENDLVASVIAKMIGEVKEITDSPQRLHELCKNYIHEDTQRSRNWPKTPAAFSRRLRVASNTLRELGITVEFTRSNERLISIMKI